MPNERQGAAGVSNSTVILKRAEGADCPSTCVPVGHLVLGNVFQNVMLGSASTKSCESRGVRGGDFRADFRGAGHAFLLRFLLQFLLRGLLSRAGISYRTGSGF